MNFLAKIWRSSLGKKYLMAITGIGLFGFVIGHMAGNLQVFLPDDGHALNRYAHFLKTTPEILWPARIGLLAFVGIHIWTAISLTLENRAARRTRYAVAEVVDASYASRTMAVSGGIVLAFGRHLFVLRHYPHPARRTRVPAGQFPSNAKNARRTRVPAGQFPSNAKNRRCCPAMSWCGRQC